jgi:hypothetical protein
MAVAAMGLVVGILGAAPASALTIDAINGTWTNVVGGTNVGFYTVGDEVQIRWGNPIDNGAIPTDQSGLGFTGAAPPQLVFDVGEFFEIGTLRHFNNVIRWGAVDAADLVISLVFSDPVLVAGQTFTFQIDETPNSGPCSVGSPPCPDIIGFPSAFAEETFDIGGVDHTLEIAGFQTSLGGSLVDAFVSPENGTNSALLVGRVVRAGAAVPEPNSVLLFGAGAVIVARRLRRGRRPAEG